MSDSRESVLLLGGSRHQVPAIEAAKRLGYRTVLIDYLPDNPGQHVADVYYPDSTTDREGVIRIAREEGVSGIVSFGSDAAAPSAAYACEQLGLPTNPLESVEILSEKQLFRPYLLSHGFPSPQATMFKVDDPIYQIVQQTSTLSLPFVVKPTDSSGSKGVNVVTELTPSAIAHAVEQAQPFSRNKILIAEEYVEKGYPHLIGGDVFVANGRVCFWGLMDCLRDSSGNGLVPVGKSFPTALTPSEEATVKEAVQDLVSSLHISFGEMNVEVMLDPHGVPHIMELGARAGGNMIPVLMADMSGIDVVGANVTYALGRTDPVMDFDQHEPYCAISVLHCLHDGIYRGIHFSKELERHAYRKLVYVSPGQRVSRFTDGSKAIGLLFLRFDDAQQMHHMLSNMGKHVYIDRVPAPEN